MGDVNRGLFVFFNEQELNASIERCQARAEKLEKQMSAIGDKSSPEFLKLQKQLEATNAKTAEFSKRLSGDLAPSLNQVKQAAQKAWNELQHIPIGTPEWKAKMAEFNVLNEKFIQVKANIGAVGRVMESFASKVKTIAAGVLIGNTVQAAAQSIGSYFSGFLGGAAKISDEISDIEKTTNLTTGEVKELNKEIGKIDTRTGSSKLRQYAEDAGKLGKEGVRDIEKFVEEANQIDVSLGEDLGEGAVTKIAKEADIFQIGMLKIASGINTVGQSSSANEGFLTEFLFRMSGTGKTVKVAAGDLLGFGAALDINGQQIEASSTALQTFFIDFRKDTEKFGKAAGFAKGELTKLAESKGINVAFLEFLKRLKETSTSSDVLLKKLEALGIDGARGANTFLTLAGNIELVKQQQEFANKAIAEGTSITAEYEKRNNNFAGTVEKISKEWSKLTASSAVQDFLKSGATVTLQFVKALGLLPGVLYDNRNAIQLLLLVLVFYYRQKIANTLATAANTVTEYANIAAKRVQAFTTGLATAATAIYATAVDVLTGKVSASIVASLLWDKALKLLTLSLGALVAIGAAVSLATKLYIDNSKEAIEFETKRKALSDGLETSLNALAEAQKKYNTQIENFNTLSQKQRDDLRSDIKSSLSVAQKELDDFSNKQKDVAQSATASYLDYIKAIPTLITKGTAAATDKLIEDEREKGKEAAAAFDSQISNLQQGIQSLKQSLNETKPALELFNEAMLIQGLTAEDLEKKLSTLELALKRALNPAEMKRIQDAIDATKKALASLNVKLLSEKQQNELDEFKKFIEKLNALKRQVDASKEGNDEKEVQQLKEKYIALEKEAEKFFNKGTVSYAKYRETIKNIEKIFATEFEQLSNKQFSNRSEKELQASLNATASYFESLKLIEKKNFADGITGREQYEKNIEGIDALSKNTQVTIFKDYYETLKLAYKDDKDKLEQLEKQKIALQNEAYNQDYDNYIKSLERKREATEAQDNANLINAGLAGDIAGVREARLQALQHELDEKLKMYQGNEAKINEAIAKAAAERKQIESDYVSAIQTEFQRYAEIASAVYSGLSDIFNELQNRELQSLQEGSAKKLAEYKHLLDTKQIDQKEYDKLVDREQKEQAKRELDLKKSQFEENKAFRIVEATMTTFSAALNAYNAGLQTGGPAGLVLGPLMAGIAAAFGAVKIGLIASEKAPEFGKGGKAKGKLHKDGGIDVNVEDEEWIVNRKSSLKYDALLHSINRDDTAAINKWFMNRPALNLSAVAPQLQINYSNDTGNNYNDERLRKTIHNGLIATGTYIVDGLATRLDNAAYAKSRRV